MQKILFPLFLLIAFTGCSQKQTQTKTGIILISPKEFEQLLVSEKGILIDVRTPGEVKKGYIRDAKHLDIFSDDFETQLNQLDTTKTVFVYCASGGRSAEAADILIKKGFKLVYDMDGGFMRWKEQGLPFVQ